MQVHFDLILRESMKSVWAEVYFMDPKSVVRGNAK
jgi:hypothetical protein